MFVKICRKDGIEIVYECKTVTWNPYEPKKINLCIDRMDGERVIYEIDINNTVGVYYMSDTGATIDSKRF